jgi:hypothetical protein
MLRKGESHTKIHIVLHHHVEVEIRNKQHICRIYFDNVIKKQKKCLTGNSE